jgi:hypothetical protein
MHRTNRGLDDWTMDEGQPPDVDGVKSVDALVSADEAARLVAVLVWERDTWRGLFKNAHARVRELDARVKELEEKCCGNVRNKDRVNAVEQELFTLRALNEHSTCERARMAVEIGRLSENGRMVVQLLRRIITYAREDKARTPGFTRLARALEEAERIIREEP